MRAKTRMMIALFLMIVVVRAAQGITVIVPAGVTISVAPPSGTCPATWSTVISTNSSYAGGTIYIYGNPSCESLGDITFGSTTGTSPLTVIIGVDPINHLEAPLGAMNKFDASGTSFSVDLTFTVTTDAG